MNTKNKISPDFSFESKYLEVKGSKMHYIDEGHGDPILFLHGNPTSSYLWRNIVPHLTSQARCIAVDLIGMGKSDQPKIKYGMDNTIIYLEEFIQKMGLKNITLVVHDWGSILGFHYAFTHQDKIKGLVFMEGLIEAPRLETMPLNVKVGMTVVRSRLFGAFLTKRMNIFIKRMLPDLSGGELSKEALEYYASPYPTYQSREPLHAWPKDVPFKGHPKHIAKRISNYANWLLETELPKLCLYVTPGVAFKAPELKIVEDKFKNTKIVHLGEGLHFIQEVYPDEIGYEMSQWYKKYY